MEEPNSILPALPPFHFHPLPSASTTADTKKTAYCTEESRLIPATYLGPLVCGVAGGHAHVREMGGVDPDAPGTQSRSPDGVVAVLAIKVPDVSRLLWYIMLGR